MRKNNGFTLVEMIISTAIVAVLALILLKTFATAATVQRKTVSDYRAQVAAQNMVEYLKTVDFGEELGFDTPNKGDIPPTGFWDGEKDNFIRCWESLPALGSLEEIEKRALKDVSVKVTKDGLSIPAISSSISCLFIELDDREMLKDAMLSAQGEAEDCEPGSFKMVERNIAINIGLKDDSGKITCEKTSDGSNQATITYKFEWNALTSTTPLTYTNNGGWTKAYTITIPKQTASKEYGFDATYIFVYPAPGFTTVIPNVVFSPSSIGSTDSKTFIGNGYISCVKNPDDLSGVVSNLTPPDNFTRISPNDINSLPFAELEGGLDENKQTITKYTMTIHFPNKPNSGTKVADIVAEFTG